MVEPIRVGFNTWPGYEFIYLAKVKGYYEEIGLNVKLVELNSLGDVRRAFERGQIDIMASTMVEMLIAAENTSRSLKLIAVIDASSGADMLLARKGIESINDLRGKKVGMEGATVDVLVAGAALRSANLGFKDIYVVGKAQDDLVLEMETGNIDAIQTYPPFATNLLKTGKYNKIFDTSQIPGEIVDTMSVDSRVLEERRDDIRKFLTAYFRAFDYHRSNTQHANEIMGAREGIGGEEFGDALAGMQIFPRDQQSRYLTINSLGGNALKNASEALFDSGWLKQRADISQFFDSHVENLIP